MCKIATFLIIWSVLNILVGNIFFGIPALIYSIYSARGDSSKKDLAYFLNGLGTFISITAWIVIICIFFVPKTDCSNPANYDACNDYNY